MGIDCHSVQRKVRFLQMGSQGKLFRGSNILSLVLDATQDLDMPT